MATTRIKQINYISGDSYIDTLNDLIREIAGNSKRINIGAGTYTLSSALTAGGNDLVISGSGPDETIIEGNGITLLNLSSNLNIIVKGITFDGLSSAVADKIIITTCADVLFDSCRFVNALQPQNMVAVTGSTNVSFINCEFEGCTESALTADSGTSNMTVSKCTFTSCVATNVANSVQLGTDSTIVNSTFNACGVVSFQDRTSVINNQFTNSVVPTNRGAVTIGFSISSLNCIITSNTFTSPNEYAIFQGGPLAEGAIVQDNKVTLAGVAPFFVSTAIKLFTMISNGATEVRSLTGTVSQSGYTDKSLITTTGDTTLNVSNLEIGGTGHRLYVEHDVDGGFTLTVATSSPSLSIALPDAGDYVILEWQGEGWTIVEYSPTAGPDPNRIINSVALPDKTSASQAIDDDFNSTSLDVKWTVVGGGIAGTANLVNESALANSIYDLTSIPGRLLLQNRGGDTTFGIRASYTLPQNRSVILKFSPTITFNEVDNNSPMLTLSLTDSTTDPEAGTNRVYLIMDPGASELRILTAGTVGGFSDTTFATSMPLGGLSDTMYFRICRSNLVTNKFITMFSINGNSWTIMNNFTLAGTPNILWIANQCDSAYTTFPTPIQTVYWVREYSNDVIPI